jgi:hypothetical protein
MKNRFGFSKRRSSLRLRAARNNEKAVKRNRVSFGIARAVVGGKNSGETDVNLLAAAISGAE